MHIDASIFQTSKRILHVHTFMMVRTTTETSKEQINIQNPVHIVNSHAIQNHKLKSSKRKKQSNYINDKPNEQVLENRNRRKEDLLDKKV